MNIHLDRLLRLERRPVEVIAESQYAEIGIYSFGRGIFHKTPRTGLEVGNKDLFLIKEGDFILQVTFAWEGAVALASPNEDGMYGSTRFPTFRVDDSLCYPPYLTYYFKTSPGREQLVRISPGSAGRNRVLSLKRIPEVIIPLPSLVEQQRIVARIEGLTAQIEEARAFRRQAAEETEALVVTALTHLQLPSDSVTKPIAECSSMSTGTTPPSDRIDYYGGPIQWYTPGDLEFRQRLGPSSRTLSQVALAERKARMFEPGTVLLVAIGGSLGKVALTHERCSANQQITGIKFSDDVLPEYGFWWMRRLGRELMAAAPQATLPIINQRRIGVFEISIPPLPEQLRIVGELDALQSKIDALKQLQAETVTELDALLPSILDRAFKGEL